MASHLRWRIIVASTILLIFLCFVVFFQSGQTEPYLLNLPYIFWVGILTTSLLVLLTYLGAKSFPHKEN